MRRNAKYILTLCLLILLLLLTSCVIDDWSDPTEWDQFQQVYGRKLR